MQAAGVPASFQSQTECCLGSAWPASTCPTMSLVRSWQMTTQHPRQSRLHRVSAELLSVSMQLHGLAFWARAFLLQADPWRVALGHRRLAAAQAGALGQGGMTWLETTDF